MSFCVPYILNDIGPNIGWVFGGIAFCSGLLVFFVLPETKVCRLHTGGLELALILVIGPLSRGITTSIVPCIYKSSSANSIRFQELDELFQVCGRLHRRHNTRAWLTVVWKARIPARKFKMTQTYGAGSR